MYRASVLENNTEIICEDFKEGVVKILYLHPWHGTQLVKTKNVLKVNCYIKDVITVFKFQTEKREVCSKHYPTVEYYNECYNVISHGWTEPKYQDYINLWIKLDDNDCPDDIESFLNSNPTFPIDIGGFGGNYVCIITSFILIIL